MVWRGLFFVSLITGACLSGTPVTKACSCGDPGPPCRALLQTDAAFVGKVLEIRGSRTESETTESDLPHPFRRVRFLVEENFRGAGVRPGGELEVLTGFGGGDCGYDFETGERYLVYAQHLPGAEWLYAGICSRTRRLSEAATDLAYLRTRNQPERAAGIEGSIHELSRDPETKETRVIGPMRGVAVIAERDGERWEARTDEHGWFRIWGITFGNYTVRAVLPKEFIPEATTRDDVSVENGVCGWVHMLATPWP